MAKRKYRQGPFTNAEIAHIKKGFPEKTALDIALALNRSLNSVKAQLRKLGLRRQPRPKWSKTQIGKIRKLYPTTSTSQIANQLGFTLSQTKRKAMELGLKKRR